MIAPGDLGPATQRGRHVNVVVASYGIAGVPCAVLLGPNGLSLRIDTDSMDLSDGGLMKVAAELSLGTVLRGG